MKTIKLINQTEFPSQIGRYVKVNPSDPKGFIYSTESDPFTIGKVTQRVFKNELCIINPLTPLKIIRNDIKNLVSTDDPRLSDARQASDVYSWAKATTKPSYTYSDTGAEPANQNIQTHVTTPHAPTDAVNLSTVKNDLDIASALSLRHSNSLDHSNSMDHASGSDNQDLSGLQPKETGKGLSTNDYTTAEQSKLFNIEAGANNYTHPANHSPSIITQDTDNRFVSDTEKGTWNGKEAGGAVASHESSYTHANIATAYSHSQASHAPSNAQKNSDIIKSEVEAVLTGEVSSHSHAGGGGLSQQQIEGLI